MIHNRRNTDTVRHFCFVVGCHAGLSQFFPLQPRQNKVFHLRRIQGPLENRRCLGEFLLLIVRKFFFSFAMCACFFLFLPWLMYFFFLCDDCMHFFMYGLSVYIEFFYPPPLQFSYACPLMTRKLRINVKPGVACTPRDNSHFLKKHGRLKSTPSFRRR